MEDAQDIDVSIGSDQVGDAVVLVEEDSHMAPRRLIAIWPISGNLANVCARS